MAAAIAPGAGVVHAAPSDESRTYVEWILTNVAGATPTSEEIDYWATFLDHGGSRLTLTSHAVVYDQPLSFLVQLAYQTALGRDLDTAGARYWVSSIQSGRKSVAAVHVAIAASNEALRANGDTPASWVTAPYRLFLMRDPSPAEAAYWEPRSSTGAGRLAVARSIHGSGESRRAFTRFFMQVLFQREPDAGGIAYWSTRLPEIGELGVVTWLLASDEMFRLIQAQGSGGDSNPREPRGFVRR